MVSVVCHSQTNELFVSILHEDQLQLLIMSLVGLSPHRWLDVCVPCPSEYDLQRVSKMRRVLYVCVRERDGKIEKRGNGVRRSMKSAEIKKGERPSGNANCSQRRAVQLHTL